MKVVNNFAEIDANELFLFIKLNSLPQQVKISCNNNLDELLDYLKEYNFFIFINDSINGIVTYKKLNNKCCYVEDLVIKKNADSISREEIWKFLINCLNDINYIKFKTYERLIPFYERRLKSVYHNKFLYCFLPYLKKIDFDKFSTKKININNREYIELKYYGAIEIIDLSTKLLVGIETNDFKVFSELSRDNELKINVTNKNKLTPLTFTLEEQVTFVENYEQFLLQNEFKIEEISDGIYSTKLTCKINNEEYVLEPGLLIDEFIKLYIDDNSLLKFESYLLTIDKIDCYINNTLYSSNSCINVDKEFILKIMYEKSLIFEKKFQLPFINKTNLNYKLINNKPIIVELSSGKSDNILISNLVPKNSGNLKNLFLGIMPFIYYIDGYETSHINTDWEKCRNSPNCTTYKTSLTSLKNYNISIDIKYKFIDNKLYIYTTCSNNNNWYAKYIVYILCFFKDSYLNLIDSDENFRLYKHESEDINIKLINFTGICVQESLGNYNNIPTCKNVFELFPNETNTCINLIEIW